VIDATSGKIDVRAPMGVDSHYACGFLVLPSWQYARLPGAHEVALPPFSLPFSLALARARALGTNGRGGRRT
jgi:hypothetical protein